MTFKKFLFMIAATAFISIHIKAEETGKEKKLLGTEGQENEPTKKSPVVPVCKELSVDSPLEQQESYCDCTVHRTTVVIKCQFNHTEDVILTGDIYPFRNTSKLGSAYVRVVNASTVHVTKDFLTELMQVPSIALDLWKANELILDPMPEPEENHDVIKKYKTFVGIGIVDCSVPTMPKYFMRDRTRGGLRIKNSYVKKFQEGVLHNMEEMRYLVFEDSAVDIFEGSVATEGFVSLSARQIHSWNGLMITNSSINVINSGVFNITHKSDMETALISDSRIGRLSKDALNITGDIDVTIKKNVFESMETNAIKIAVTGDVVFDKNDIADWELDALEGLICHKRTSLEENTFRVDDPTDIAINISTTPFHTSCGNPQLFLVISPQQALAIEISTTASWVLAFALIILLLGTVTVATYFHRRQNLFLHFYRTMGRLPLSSLRERRPSQQNLPNGEEIAPSTEVTEDGVSNPIYVDVKENC